MKDDATVKIIFDDITYNVDPEDWPINAAPLNGAVFKRENVKTENFLKYFTQVTDSWKWIEKSKGGRDAMKDLRKN